MYGRGCGVQVIRKKVWRGKVLFGWVVYWSHRNWWYSSRQGVLEDLFGEVWRRKVSLLASQITGKYQTFVIDSALSASEFRPHQQRNSGVDSYRTGSYSSSINLRNVLTRHYCHQAPSTVKLLTNQCCQFTKNTLFLIENVNGL
jgi:hypothetical protein